MLEFDQFRLLDQSWGNEATERLAGELAASFVPMPQPIRR